MKYYQTNRSITKFSENKIQKFHIQYTNLWYGQWSHNSKKMCG